ncbi:hypothetical protein BH18THE2_BH18THE2_40170 [soil metagenome]
MNIYEMGISGCCSSVIVYSLDADFLHDAELTYIRSYTRYHNEMQSHVKYHVSHLTLRL